MNTLQLLLTLFMCINLASINAQSTYHSGIGNPPVTNTSLVSLVCDTVFSFPAIDTWPTGITSDGNFLFSNGNDGQVIYKHNFAGTLIDSIPNPFNQPTNYTGGDMDFDGTNLLMFGEQNDTLYKINPVTGAVVNQFIIAPCNLDCFGVAYDGTDIWISDYVAQQIYKVDANTGALLKTISVTTPNYVLPIKFINGQLYGLGIFPGQLYEIDTTSGNILSVQPWCLGYSIGFCKVNNSIWAVSSDIAVGGTQRIYQFESFPLGEEENLSATFKVSVFPNPSKGIINISSDRMILNGNIEIYNALGRLTLSEKIENETLKQVELTKPVAGMYCIRIFDGEKYHYCRIFIH
jgi:hypothetical protein